MYHVELRQFPHNSWQFNLSQEQLRAITEPWVRGTPVEFGERRWSPEKARLKIIDGPELAVAELSMGRGPRTAEREGTDVTERLLAEARQRLGEAVAQAAPTGTRAPGAGAASADPLALGVQIATLLGPDAIALLDAWRETARSAPALRPSQALARAEEQLEQSTPHTRN